MTPIHVLLAADARFVRPLAACLSSLVATHALDPIRVSIMTDSISSRDKKLLTQITEIDWLDIDPRIVDDVQMPSYLPIASAWRLMVTELLPPSDHRVLYLDADTLVRSSLRPLWEQELGGQIVAAVRDPVVPWFGAPIGPPWRELNVAPDAPYFNAGVLLIDIDAWREQNIGRRALDLLKRASLPHGDQCALNTLLVTKWTRLPASWNLQAGHLVAGNSMAWIVEPANEIERAITDPHLVHFNTSKFGRPWLSDCSHPFRLEWQTSLDLTPWAGWRPTAPTGLQRVRKRLRRAAQALRRL